MMTETKIRANLPNLVADVPNLANGIIADPNTKTTYRIGKFLGKGGFARVHEVTNLHNNITYAAKIIPKSKMTRKYHIAKVAREIMLHKDLIHDNVVKLELFFEDGINAYIMLENCPNQSLVHLMKKKPCFSIHETRYYVKQLIAGTKYIHSNNIIHRDLKPGNMFLSENMVVKIGDFGLAMSLDKMSEQAVLCGTPNYIAPEVLNKSSQSFPIDVWAIGCTIYCLMFGIPPYESASLELTYERIKSNNWDKSKAAYYPVLIDLLDRVLVLDPNERLTLDEIEKHIFFDAVSNELLLEHMHLNNSIENDQAIVNTHNNNINIKNNNYSNDSYNIKLIKDSLSHRKEVEDSDRILISKRRTSTIKYLPPQQNTDQPRKVSTIKKIVQNIFKKRKNIKSFEENKQLEDNNMLSGNDHSALNSRHKKVAGKGQDDGAPRDVQRLCPKTISLKDYCKANNIGTNSMLLKVLEAICDAYAFDKDYKGNNIPKIPEYNLVFVAKWIDYSNKYGFGYQLTNNSNGVLFNDSSTFIMRSNCSNFQYLDAHQKSHTFQVNDLPKSLEQKYLYLKYFKDYMDEKLSDGAAVRNENALSCMDNYENPIVKRWNRTATEILMELSDGTFQANFAEDHTKVVLSFRDTLIPAPKNHSVHEWANGIVVTFINSNREMCHYKASNLLHFRPGKLLITRLKYLRCAIVDFAKLD